MIAKFSALLRSTSFTAPLIAAPILLSACASGMPSAPTAFQGIETLPPIRTVMECLPPDAALVAAHRGTSESYNEPENSLSALERLIERGIMMAEIDIAAIADGTPIIFHDGVWDYHTSDVGPVVSTPPEQFARLRLKTTDGLISGESVPTLGAMLDAAKDRIYLEVDFKTSADMGGVIEMIRDRDMVDQVVLIATNDEEAAALAPYMSDFLMSLPQSRGPNAKGPKQGVWIGSNWRDGAEQKLGARHYAIGAQWKKNPSQLPKAARALDILVTDQAQRYTAVAGLESTAAFRKCISQ